MNTVSKWALASLLALTVFPVAAPAQIYDLSITMTGLPGAGPTTFAGSFDFNPAGTAGCSAAFCPPGAIPEFTNVHITDPVSPGGASAFTDAVGGSTNLNFLGAYSGAPGQTTFDSLSFTIDTPLGGPAPTIGLDNIEYFQTANGSNSSCGGSTTLATLGVTCSQATLKVDTVKAPEIDPSSAVSALTLLLGALAVLRGRRLVSAEPTASA